VAHVGVVVAVQRSLCRFGIAVERKLGKNRSGHKRGCAREQPSSSEFSHA
jgi:hypothetical protein